MTRVPSPRLQPGAFPFQVIKLVKAPYLVYKKPAAARWKLPQLWKSGFGGLRQLLLDDFHKLLGKAFAKNDSGFSTVTTASTTVSFSRI